MQEQELLVKVIEMEEVIIGIRKDGLGHAYLKPGAELGIRLQEKMLDAYLCLTGGKKHAFIFEAGDYVSITKEARENARYIQDRSPVRAIAAVTDNLAYRLVADFYSKVHKPRYPFKAVGSIQEAIRWLHSPAVQVHLVETGIKQLIQTI